MAQYGWKYSIERCTGCRACVVACRMENNWPETTKYRWVTEVESGTFPNVSRDFFSTSCMHCEEPACMAACDNIGVGAISRDATFGAIVIDQDLCIGCGHCVGVCPYGAPQFNAETEKAVKCNLCVDRLGAGMRPACVDTCTAEALRLEENSSGPSNTTEAVSLGFANPDMTGPNIRFD